MRDRGILRGREYDRNGMDILKPFSRELPVLISSNGRLVNEEINLAKYDISSDRD